MRLPALQSCRRTSSGLAFNVQVVDVSPNLYVPAMDFSATARRSWLAAELALLVVLAFPSRSQAVDAGVEDAGALANAGAFDAGLPDSDPRIAQIRALINGTLGVNVEPQDLFTVPLTDESAQQVERVRIAVLLGISDGRVDARVAPSAKAKAKPTSSASRSTVSADATVLSSPEWLAREQVDRARLEYYSLSKQQRDDLLFAHNARVEAAKPKETEEQRHAREAEAERKRALEAAQTARNEAERIVSKELARLIELERNVSQHEARFKEERLELASRKESLFGWQKRVTDARSTPELSDTVYDALHRTLRASREELARALDQLEAAHSAIPNIGPNPLIDLPSNVALGAVSRRRKAVETKIDAARREERTVLSLRSATLLSEMDALNADRLSLLSSLSSQKRSSIIGFTETGFEQSRSEARQLLLILRYHARVAQGWLSELRNRQRLQGVSYWPIAAVVIPWLLGVAGFAWLRRRIPSWLSLVDERLADLERRGQQASPSLLR